MKTDSDELLDFEGGELIIGLVGAMKCDNCGRIDGRPSLINDGSSARCVCDETAPYPECMEEFDHLKAKCPRCEASTPLTSEYCAYGGILPTYPCYRGCDAILAIKFNGFVLSPSEFVQLGNLDKDVAISEDGLSAVDHRDTKLDWLNRVGYLLSKYAKRVDGSFRSFDRDHFNLWLVHDGETPVGYISWKFHNGETPLLSQMYLVPHHRGRGIGAQVLQSWCQELVGKNGTYIVESPNERMLGLLQSIGHYEGSAEYSVDIAQGM